MNSRAAYLMVRAYHKHRAEIFAKQPQQSDFVAIWSRQTIGAASRLRRQRLDDRIKGLTPEPIKRVLRPLLPRDVRSDPRLLREFDDSVRSILSCDEAGRSLTPFPQR